jgi:hypothetical protein
LSWPAISVNNERAVAQIIFLLKSAKNSKY